MCMCMCMCVVLCVLMFRTARRTLCMCMSSRPLIFAQGLDFREFLRKFGNQLGVLLSNKILLAEHPGMIREFVSVYRTLRT